ncbi:YHS domain-containing protein [Pedobacter sp. ASV12]|uniref:YHS domain-containing protein n=1 Tax=Pedobacter sp. ASV12 TaxID=2795120 RepID=UPI0018ED2780|nr:YHS domain-containing protein [Pedobacter sp. ASV12]
MKIGLIVLGVLGGTAFYSGLSARNIESARMAQQTDTLKKEGKDPVCGMKVPAGTAKTIVYEKVTYGFCSEGCKKKFAEKPGKYIKKS